MLRSNKKNNKNTLQRKIEVADSKTVVNVRNEELSSGEEGSGACKTDRNETKMQNTVTEGVKAGRSSVGETSASVFGSRGEEQAKALGYEEHNVNYELYRDETQTYVRSSELGDLIRALTEKFDQCDVNKNKNFVSIESFAKVVPDCDGVSIPVRQWIENFEENAEAYELSEKQKYANARNKMIGTAKLFLETTTVANYESLCAALVEEFDQQLSSAELHKQLRSRKKRETENFHEYVLQMRKIAALGEIEEESIITYIVDGLEVSDDMKFPLYSAPTFKELRKRYELVEILGKNNSVNKRRPTTQTHIHTRGKGEADKGIERKQQHCYNCGSSQHKRAECKEETKCFKCNGVGHMAKQCVKAKQSINVVRNECRVKEMTIDGTKIKCLVDTGADVSLVRKGKYDEKFEGRMLHKCFAKLFGLGNVTTAVLGEFAAQVEVDGLKTEHTFLVVPDAKLNVDVIVGYDFLQKFTITLNSGGYTFALNKEAKVEEAEYNVFNVVNSNTVLDVDFKYAKAVTQFIDNYKPINNPVSCPIKLSIVPNCTNIAFRESPSRLPAPEREFVQKQIDEWLQQGIVRESCSDVASKVVLAKKKDGSYRVCVDYRKLNSLVLKDRFPVPVVEEVLEKMQSAKYFTVMDLKNGFFHVEIEEQSRKYTAFVTKEGLFEFNKAPFGFCNSPAVFVRFINYIFQHLINEGIMEIYIDDIVIFGCTVEQCMTNMQTVLKQAQQYGLEIKWSKCQFLKERISFLGHEVENGHVWPGQEKIKAVKNFPLPKNIRGVQAFLGLTGYFRKFIQDYAVIARPLTQLLKKDSEFKIQGMQIQAIEKLKSALVGEPVLRIYKQNARTQLHVDASKDGFGATLLQQHDNKWHPVFFWSKKTSPQEEKLHSYFLEVKAAYLATKKLRHYLMGIEFDLVTDCAAFKMTTKKKDVPREVVQWLMYLQDFSYNIEHRAGNRMKHVDSLSRYPVMIVTSEVHAQILRTQQKDEHLAAVAEILKQKPYADFKMKNQLIYKQIGGLDLLAVPKSMEKEIISSAHNFGHTGTQKTMHAIRQDFYIPQLERKVNQHIANCIECIIHNKKLGKQEDFLHCIDKGDTPLTTLHVDHLGTLDSTSKNYKYIFAMVDGFSKYTWLFPTKSTDAQEVIKHVSSWVTIFGSPQRIISDRGAAFTSKQFKDFCTSEKIEHVETTTGTPRGNGQIERVNRVILSVLAKMSAAEPSKWYKYTSQVQRVINAHVHSSTKFTPFEIMFGVKMRNNSDVELLKILQEEMLMDLQEERNLIRAEARHQIEKAQETYKRNHDKKRKGHHGYKLSDLVAIKVTQFVTGKKLANKYIGPYEVIKVKRNGRYDVKKAAEFQGPHQTSTSADHMKLWRYIDNTEDDSAEESSEADDEQDDRM